MRVFHGSYVKIEEIDLNMCEIGKDFGRGFYVTKIREQAEFWAMRKGIDNQTDGVVTEFEFKENAFLHFHLKIVRFEKYDDAWLDFCTGRSLQMLDLSENTTEIDSKIAEIGESLIAQLMLDGRINEIKATDLFFSSAVFSKLSEKSTGFYLKTPQEIYEMIKKELNL